MINLDEVLREITEWQSKLAAARDNLLALYDHPTYKRLDSQTSVLTGETAAQVTPALTAMNVLFAQMGLLTDVVDRAARIQQRLGRFAWSDRPIKEIQALLQGPSIQLPPITTPLAQRGLLTSAEQVQAITPERLLTAMTLSFDTAKSAVLAVDTAWSQLDPMLASCDLKLATLTDMAKTVGDEAETQVAELQRQLDNLRILAQTDPLFAAHRAADRMQSSFERTRSQVQTLAQQCIGLRSRLEKAKATVDTITTARRRADAAADKCRRCIVNPKDLLSSISDQQMDELDEWLDVLTQCERQGRWTALATGMDRWEQSAREYAEAQNSVVAANEAPLETLAELKGRASALKVKARVRGLADQHALVQAERLATECLNRPKVPLDEATRLVTEYEQHLSK